MNRVEARNKTLWNNLDWWIRTLIEYEIDHGSCRASVPNLENSDERILKELGFSILKKEDNTIIEWV